MDWSLVVGALTAAASGAAALGAWKAAQAAETAVALGADTAQRQLRAYVSAVGRGVHDAEAPFTFEVVISLTNDGQTPAHHLAASAGAVLQSFPPAPDLQSLMASLRPDGRNQTLSPGGTTVLYAFLNQNLTKETRDWIASGDGCILVFGVVTYEDAFGIRRQTDFCHYYRGEELSDTACRYHSEGNGAT